MTGKQLETDYVHAYMSRCALEFRNLRLFRRNTGVIRLDNRVFRAGIPGQCDLYGIFRSGVHIEIECKRFTKLSPAQEEWRQWCHDWGIPWLKLDVRKDEAPTETIDRWVIVTRAFFARAGLATAPPDNAAQRNG